MIPSLDDYDWQEAFGYAGEPDTCASSHTRQGEKFPPIERSHVDSTTALDPFTREDVTTILAMDEGEHDGPPWIIAGQLKDGRWFFLEAGCDYTGWDCQAGGSVLVAGTKDDLIRYCITDEHRARLKLEIS